MKNPKDPLNKMSDPTNTLVFRDTPPIVASERCATVSDSQNNKMDDGSNVKSDTAASCLKSDPEDTGPRLASLHQESRTSNFKSTADECEPSTIETALSSQKLPASPGDAAKKIFEETETKEDAIEVHSPIEKEGMIPANNFQVHSDIHVSDKSTSNKDIDCICSDPLNAVPGLDSRLCLPLVVNNMMERNDIDSQKATSIRIMLPDKTVCDQSAPISEVTSAVDSAIPTHSSIGFETQSETQCTAVNEDGARTVPPSKSDENYQSTLDAVVSTVENVGGEATGTEGFSVEPRGTVTGMNQLAITSSDGRGDEDKHGVENPQFAVLEDNEGDQLAGDMMDFTNSQMMELDEQCNFINGSQTSLKPAEVTARGDLSFTDRAIQTACGSSMIEDSTPMVQAMIQDLQQLNSSVMEVIKQIKDFRQQRHWDGVRHVQQQQSNWSGYGKIWKRPYLNQR